MLGINQPDERARPFVGAVGYQPGPAIVNSPAIKPGRRDNRRAGGGSFNPFNWSLSRVEPRRSDVGAYDIHLSDPNRIRRRLRVV